MDDNLKFLQDKCDEINLMIKYCRSIHSLNEIEKELLAKKMERDRTRRNRERLLDYVRTYRNNNTNGIRDAIICEICGGKYQKYTYKQHVNFNKHKKAVEAKKDINKLEQDLIPVDELEQFLKA